MGLEAFKYAITGLQWLGLRPSQFNVLGIPRSTLIAQAVSRRSGFDGDQAISKQALAEIREMEATGVQAELEALRNTDAGLVQTIEAMIIRRLWVPFLS